MRSLLMDSGSRAVLCQDGPEDEDDRFVVLSDTVRTAKHHHDCDGGCDGGFIAPGESHQRLVVIEDGKLTCVRMCLTCSVRARP
jgi:hypothetical protein